MVTKDRYDEMIQKYRDIAKAQSSYSFTTNFNTPTMGEMIEEDLAYDAMMKIVNDIDGSGDPRKAGFYFDAPYSETLGYHDDVGAFIVSAKVKKETYNGIDVSWIWNKYDGDTINFYLKDLDDGGKPFVIAGREYPNIQDYFWSTYKDSLGQSSGPTDNADDLKFSIRYVGIDSPEIPHFEPMSVRKSKDKIIEKKIKEIKNNPSKYTYVKYPVEKSGDDYKLVKRSDNDTVKMIQVGDVYKEIVPVNSKTLEPVSFNTKKPNYVIPNMESENVAYSEDTVTYLIVAVDDSSQATVVDGYKARDNNKKVLAKGNNKVQLVLDANSMTLNELGAISSTSIYYGSLFYTKAVINNMIKHFKLSVTDLRVQGLSYSLFGADTYGRMLGAVYIQTPEGKWINGNKFVYATTDHTQAQKDYSDAQISGLNGTVSDAFEIWTYDKENIIWMDSLEELSKHSYKSRIKLHEQLSGFNLCDNHMRNHTVLIGDTLLMIPPTSVRCVTHTQYEKQQLLRAKGSMVKGGYHNDRLLELELYFAGDMGINGIPKCHKFPSGEETTYYMNGFRGLLSQFKFSPFLPIENTYINDTLGIEAVSMVNMSVQTVPEYPGVLQVVLTLQEFNYRLFMPDLPIGIEQAIDTPSLAETTPVFAMSFQWEAFRYLYQRSLIAGEDLFKLSKDFGFNSGEYNEYLYQMRTCLQPTTACGSTVGFYIPDQNWLDQALNLKKEKQSSGVTFEPLELTDNAKNVAKELGKLYDSAKEITDSNSDFNRKVREIFSKQEVLQNVSYGTFKSNYIGYDSKYLNHKSYLTYSMRVGGSLINKSVIGEIVKPIQDELNKLLSYKTNLTGEVISSEKLSTENTFGGEATYKLNFDLKLDLSALSSTEQSALKEYISVDNQTEKEDVLNPDGGDAIDSIRTSIVIEFGPKDENGQKIKSANIETNAPQILRTLKRIGDGDLTQEDFNNDIAEELDYRNPAKMPFVPYMDEILVTDVAVAFNNTYTETKLKAMDGNASQYIGGSDAAIEIKMVTCDELVVASLNALPGIAFDLVTNYKQILPCTPLKMRNEILQLCGIHEVLIDMISIETVPEFPGMYEITMRCSSVDRTLRQRETLRKLSVTKNGGFVGNGHGGSQTIRSYFETDRLLSQAELYPDLELPTLDDLRARGYAYLRYTLSNQYRVYPDPDFYMVYGNGYTAAKIKKILEDSFATILEDNSVTEGALLSDKENQIELITALDDAVGLTVLGQCENSNNIDGDLRNLLNQIYEEKNKEAEEDIEVKRENVEDHIKFLLTTDITDGWKLKKGYQAPLCDQGINDAISNLPAAGSKSKVGEYNDAASKVKIIRKKAMELIDEILSKPIEATNVKNGVPVMPNYAKTALNTNGTSVYQGINKAYAILFEDNSAGYQLIKLLNPMDLKAGEPAPNLNYPSIKDAGYDNANTKNYITAFAYAVASARTAHEAYQGGTFQKGDYHPKIVHDSTGKPNKDKDGNYIPLCKVDVDTTRNAASLEEAVKNGYMFGPFSIRTYSAEELISLTRPELSIKYIGENYKLYKGKVSDGFLDPYYNKCDSEELEIYKRGILVDPTYAAEAYFRNILVWIRKMILDGLLFCSLDVISEEVLAEFPDGVSESKIQKAQEKVNGKVGFIDKLGDLLNPFKDEEEEEKDFDETQLYVLLATLSNTLPKSFVSRTIYPFVIDLCAGDQTVQHEILNRNYSGLEALAQASLNPASSTSSTPSQVVLNRFFKALEGLSLLKAGDIESTWADESQKMANTVQKEVYVEASNNPRKYVMHSFYDMLMNDKRGRLVRAFPTFYMIVMDEGRKIGYWKLHDNFYNMSAISDIQIVKSRKNPTDTCSITMSNMYGSYSANYNSSTTQQYADVYGVKDAINNIFSPTAYYQKSEQIRSQLSTPDTVVIKPGARIHVRLGYGSDAARLPTSFNGKIAEVNVGDVVDIVAQGDGHELCNPLTAFGSIEANHLEPSQWKVRPFKNFFGSFTRGGYSPKELLAEILSAEFGGAEEMFNVLTNGTYFNTNPFGITHFGDSKFTSIFEKGEVVQNLFEVSDVEFGSGYNELTKGAKSAKKSTPIINTSLYDKTFWDLLHMAARAGKSHIGAIRDFGFRSTVFLGRPNDYYAYQYVQQNGNIYEKRKPFQQYHYIDSYNDIIYNAITASEANMKTNATGIWQASGWFSGRAEETIGPVYLDRNIYPEYQKSMTYDTSLLADGNGGLDLKFVTKIFEKFESDETSNKVNKELARRMTINALKDSVKDMYQGQIAILGSPAIKPFDRIELVDIVEAMDGSFECESVIHSLNCTTGFTTTIIPDVIVRDINDTNEIAVQQLVKTAILPHIATTMTTMGIMHLFFRKQAKIAKALARASTVQVASGSINRHAKKLFKAVDLEAIEKLSPSISKLATELGTAVIESSGYIKLNGMKALIEAMAKTQLTDSSSIKDLVKYMEHLNNLDMDDYDRIIKEAIEEATASGSQANLDAAKEISKQLDELKVVKEGLVNGKMDFKDVLAKISKEGDLSASSITAIEDFLKKTNGVVSSSDDLKAITKILGRNDVYQFLGKGANQKVLTDVLNSADEIVKFSDKATGGIAKFISTVDLKDFDKALDLIKVAKGAGALVNMASCIPLLAETLVVEFAIANAKESFMSWFEDMQTLTVFPMKQHDRHFYAGMNGFKGAVYGSPPADGWNSIQGMVIRAYDYLMGEIPLLSDALRFIRDFSLGGGSEFEQAANTYRAALGLIETPDTEYDMATKIYSNVSNQLMLQGRTIDSLKTRARIQSFDSTMNNVKSTYTKYRLTKNSDTNELYAVEFDSMIADYISKGKFEIAHNLDKRAVEDTVAAQGGASYKLKLVTFTNKNGSAADVPMLRQDSLETLKLIISETNKHAATKEAKIFLKSGTRINGSDWRSTGYQFVIGSTEDISSSIDNVIKTLNGGKYKVFKWNKLGAGEVASVKGADVDYRITIYPPLYTN